MSKTKKADPERAKTLATPLATSLETPPPKTQAQLMAAAASRPSTNAAAVMVAYTDQFGEQDFGALADCLAESVQEAWSGDMRRAEAMLLSQAHALQSIFVSYARRAQKQQYQKNLEGFLRLALKAQSQCRMTLETLGNLKNPPVVFAKQANINNGGQQQVNNGTAPSTPAPAAREETAKGQTNELLENDHGQRLDTRAPGATGRDDPRLATVAAGNRPPHG